MVKKIDSLNFYKVIEENRKVLVCFTDTTCKMYSKCKEYLEGLIVNDDLLICEINYNDNKEIMKEYGVDILPVFLLFINGSVCDKRVGIISYDELVQLTK